MDTGKPEDKNWFTDGLRDLMDLNEEQKKKKRSTNEPIGLMTHKSLDLPRRIGGFTPYGDSFKMR